MTSNSSEPEPGSISQLSFQRVVEQSFSSIVITDALGVIQYVNPAFERQTGYAAVEVIGANPRVLKAGTMPRAHYQELWNTISRGKQWTGRLHNRRKDGTVFWERAVIGPVFDDDGTIVQYIAIKQDITDLQLATERVGLLGAIIEQSDQICAVRDLEDRLVAVNKAYELSTGLTREQLVGRSVEEIFDGKVRDSSHEDFYECIRRAKSLPKGQCASHEVSVCWDGSRWFDYWARFFPVFDASDKLIGTASIAQDVTERNDLQRDLLAALRRAETANRAKAAFLATMSHELRTPLNAIIGLAETICDERALDGSMLESVAWIHRSSELLLAQIEGVLEYSQLQAGECVFAQERIDLLACLVSAIASCADEAQAKGVELYYDLAESLPASFVGDSAKLEQIILQVLGNACKFTDHGSVHLRAETFSNEGCPFLRIGVTDTGVGIDGVDRERIFEPFVQVDSTDTRRHGGAGLGLAIARGYVRAMGGSLTVESVAGRGSCFTTELPLNGPSEKTLWEAHAPSLPLRSPVYLVVEEPHLNTLCHHWLQAAGAAVFSVAPRDLDSCIAHAPEGGWIILDRALSGDVPAIEEAALRVVWLRSTQPFGHDRAHPRHYHLPALPFPSDLAMAFDELAREPGQDSHREVPDQTQAPSRPLRILFADDLETNREVVRIMVRHLGQELDLVCNGAEAVAAASREPGYDLIFLDLQMPVMDGFEAARRIRARLGDAAPRIVAITANSHPGVPARCREVGMDGCLIKPVLPAQLRACLKGLGHGDEVAFGRQSASFADRSGAPVLSNEHLDAMLGEIADEVASDLLVEWGASLARDFRTAAATLEASIQNEDSDAAIAPLHGLKGVARTIGLPRMQYYCEGCLEQLRTGTFQAWDDLLPQLDRFYRDSSDALNAYRLARAGQPQQAVQA